MQPRFQSNIDLFHNGGLLIYSFLCMIISLSDVVWKRVYLCTLHMLTRSVRLIIIHVKEYINRPAYDRGLNHRSTSFPIKYTIESMVYCSHLPNLVSTGWLLPPKEFRPEGEILRRHPSSLRVYKGKYLKLKKGVSIPEKSLDLLERGPRGIVGQWRRFNPKQCYTPTSKKWLGWRKIKNSQMDRLGWFTDIYCTAIGRYSSALGVCSLTFCGAAVLRVLKQTWNFHFFVSFYSLKQAQTIHRPRKRKSCVWSKLWTESR